MSRRVMRGVSVMMRDAERMRQRTPGGARGKHEISGSTHGLSGVLVQRPIRGTIRVGSI